MDLQNISLQIPELREILNSLNLSAEIIAVFKKHDRFIEYLLDGKYIFRISESELPEHKKIIKINSLPLVSKIQSAGLFNIFGREYHYSLFEYIKGVELWSVASNLTGKEQYGIGKEIAQFLNELHSITDDFYDVGHYIPAVPRWGKSWKSGHLEYAVVLKNGLSKINLKINNRKTISKTFDYIYANIDSLDYQTGARLLHNDFHPKNILVHEDKLTGIVDWECSQFGEADFELSRLFDWCVYPENYLIQTNNLDVLLKSVIEHLRITTVIPDMEKRMTVYQLEHELNQLIWNGGKQEEERISRINGWLDGKVGVFLKQR